MNYKGRDANKHLTLTIKLTDVREMKWNDRDRLAPLYLTSAGICLAVCQCSE